MSSSLSSMQVIKRNGKKEELSFDKILIRIRKLGQEADIHINYQKLVMEIIDQLYDNITTKEIDELSAEQCANSVIYHYNYGILAGRIAVSNHHKNTLPSFVKTMKMLFEFVDSHGVHRPLISAEIMKFLSLPHVSKSVDAMIDYKRDYCHDYFSFKTLERAYLLRKDGKVVERAQHMWMRVAVGIHGLNVKNKPEEIENALTNIKQTYDLLSQKYYTHATPTLFNCCTNNPQMSSCYLVAMEDDSLDGIYRTLSDCATISKYAGGIGVHISNIRAKGTHIHGTNGQSNGIVPMLKVFNSTARYVDQCLHPDTIIYTSRGLLPIKDIVVGDKIITDDGQLNQVCKLLHYDNYVGDMYKFNINCADDLRVTDMHPLWVVQNPHGCTLDAMLNRMEHNLQIPDFIEAKDINVIDFVGIPLIQYECDAEKYTEELCAYYGQQKIYDNTILHLPKPKLQIYLTELLKSYTMFQEICTFDQDEMWIYFSASSSTQLSGTTVEMMHALQYMLLRFETLAITEIDHVSWLTTNDKYTNKSFKMRIPLNEFIFSIVGDLIEIQCPQYTTKYSSVNQSNYCMISNLNDRCLYMKHGNYLYTHIKSIECLECKTPTPVVDIEVDNEMHHNYLTQHGLVHNGGGKRKGSIAIYLEPWHADVIDFIGMKDPHGQEDIIARDLFYALWIPDLFMERVKDNKMWSLMCPHECPGLNEVYGDEFVKLYEKYESEGRFKKQVPAQTLWMAITDMQTKSGGPYLLYKDAANKKSNQKNLGVIKSSNLCCEIIEYSDSTETAVCNLASIALPTFVCKNEDNGEYYFDYAKLHEVTKVVTSNLNKVIDVSFYPTEKTKKSNMRHRPIGIGVQGLLDVFMMLNIAFTSDMAKDINVRIFETIYHGALERSCELAQIDGVYETFRGSPASKGILQFDMWNVVPSTGMYDWNDLKSKIVAYGLRNSLLVAPMPTATTSQILGFNECFEPLTNNFVSRRTLAGNFTVVNKYLMQDLIDLGQWNEAVKQNIIAHRGSVQQLPFLSDNLKEKHKIVWEIKQKHIIDMAADRGAFICQSQSMNLWIEHPTHNVLTSMHFYAWKKGLKTGMYYLRSKPVAETQQFTVEVCVNDTTNNHQSSSSNDGVCESCSA